ncbi:hypothetical protein AgCh_011636 [Apium graveolens]
MAAMEATELVPMTAIAAVSRVSIADLTLTGYLEFGITKGGGKYGNEGLSFGNGEVVESDKAVVAADDARCSKTGVSILGQGGHAVDAAVATALCLGVVNAMASGIGGGAGFMVVRSSATSRTEAINMRETAPIASCHLEMGGHAVDAAVATALCLGVVNAMASGIGGGGFMVVRSSATSRTEAINMRDTAPIAFSQLTLDINWGVAAGQESIEATRRRVPTDPRLHREPTDLVDSTIPIIPIMPMEEEGNLLSNSSPFLTSSSMNGETMALAIDAVNALNGVALGQGEPAVGLGMFMQWLNTDTVRKFFSRQSFTGIEATKSVPSETPDQFYRDVLDLDLLAHLLQNPGDVDKLIKICDSTAKGRSCASAIATIPESLLTFPRENTTPGHNSHCITGESSAPPITVSSMVTSSSNKSLINNDIPSLEATMAPMSPLYSSPSTNWESDMEIESPISENGTVAGMRMEPPISPVATFSLPQTASLQPPLNGLPSLLHRDSPLLQMHPYPVSGQTALTAMGLNPLVNDLVTLLMVNQWAAANMIAAFSHSTPPMNCSSLGANTQIVGQRPSTIVRSYITVLSGGTFPCKKNEARLGQYWIIVQKKVAVTEKSPKKKCAVGFTFFN